MFPIIQNHHPVWNSPDFARSGAYFSGTHISNLSTYQQKNTDITIMTSEGDKVTLSANSQQEASYLTYSSLIRRGNAMASIQGKSCSMEVNQDFSITIEGELNEEELQDIQESIKAIDKIMQATISGNVDEAFTMTQSIGDMDTISGFSANLEIETSMSFVKQTAVETQAIVPEMMDSKAPGSNSMPQDYLNNSTEKMMEVLRHRGLGNKKLLKPLRKYFSKLFKGIPEKYKGPEKYEKLGLAQRLHSEILERLKKEAREEINPNPDLKPEPVIEEPTKTVEATHSDEGEENLTDVEINEDQGRVEA